MATPPNIFTKNVITINGDVPPSQPVGAPYIITLDFDTLGITEYSLSALEFRSYLVYIFLTGASTGTSPTIYLPSTHNMNGQTVMIKNLTPENYYRGIDPSKKAGFDVCAFYTEIGTDNVGIYLKYGLENNGLQILLFSNHAPVYPMNQPFKN